MVAISFGALCGVLNPLYLYITVVLWICQGGFEKFFKVFFQNPKTMQKIKALDT